MEAKKTVRKVEESFSLSHDKTSGLEAGAGGISEGGNGMTGKTGAGAGVNGDCCEEVTAAEGPLKGELPENDDFAARVLGGDFTAVDDEEDWGGG